MQKQLKMEKLLKKKENEITTSAISYFEKFLQAFSISEKKTFKENLLPFFATQEEIKLYVKEPYPKYEEKKPDEWFYINLKYNKFFNFLRNELMSNFKDNITINVLRNNLNSKFFDPESILSPQFSGVGQIVEFSKDTEKKKINICICNVYESNWVLIYLKEIPK